MFSKTWTTRYTADYSNKIRSLKKALESADAVVIGAGSGVSTSAGFTYTGERFEKFFGDFARKYGYNDMYSGGFYPYSSLEEYWAFWSRYIYINRYVKIPRPVYEELLKLIENKEYFVITTNVDHCFQKACFDKSRLFYTQGDYGLVQCVGPCHKKTYDNEELVRKMVIAQGFEFDKDGELIVPEGVSLKMKIPSELVPKCPKCGRPLTMNLRTDDSFVEDDGWEKATSQYSDFLRKWKDKKVLFLELGIGSNTPVIIKYPFWRMTLNNPDATYACINKGEAYCISEIMEQSICIDGDIGETISDLQRFEI